MSFTFVIDSFLEPFQSLIHLYFGDLSVVASAKRACYLIAVIEEKGISIRYMPCVLKMG
jgi:hypothetical protein